MKRILTSMVVLGGLATGAYAQKDLSLTALLPVNNQQYSNFAAGDTMVVAAILTNEGPEDLGPTDSITVTFDLNWLIGPQGYVFRDVYHSSELNSSVSGGKDTFSFAFIQGANLGNTDDGPAIVTIPMNAVENGINFKVHGIQGGDTLFNDPGTGLDANNQIVHADNNFLELSNVTFGDPNSIFNVNGLAKTQLNVYPNPAKEKVSFTASLVNADASVRVMDIAGRTVLTKELGKQVAGEKEITVDVTSLNNGMYYVELVNGENRATSKITIAK